MIVAAKKILVNKSLSRSTTKSNQKIIAVLTNAIVLLGLIPHGTKPASAQTILGCDAVVTDLLDLSNSAVASYTDRSNGQRNRLISNTITTSANTNSEANQPLRLVSQGVQDVEGNSVAGLGAIASNLIELFKQQGLSEEDANLASIETISKWAALPPETSSMEVAAVIKQASVAKIEDPSSEELIEQIPNSDLLTTLAGLQESNLRALGLTQSEVETASQTTITPKEDDSFNNQILSVTQEVVETITRPEAQAQITAAQEQYQQELNNIRQGNQTTITTGNLMQFKFRLDNQTDEVAEVELPNAQAITENGLTGSGRVTGVTYRLATAINNQSDESAQAKDITENPEKVSIPANKSLEFNVEVEVGEISETEVSSIALNLQPSCASSVVQSLNILPLLALDNDNELIDPLGQITGCAGDILPEYRGFSVALYDPDPADSTGSSIEDLTTLTNTELPDDPDNNTPQGVEPNIENSNPFFLTNSDLGRYSFLLDLERNQLDFGATYILLVNPPQNSIYNQRRVKLTIGDRSENIVEYTATSLDGRPIRATDGRTTITGEIVLVEDAERVGLDLAVLDLSASICDAQEIQITKTGDRATAEPGDVVLYRLAIRNLSSTPISNVQITDILPAGFKLEADSVRAEIDEELVAMTTTQRGRQINFTTDITLDTNEIINLVYAAQLTPNALRGSGQNSAIVNAQRTDNNNSVQDGPAIHNLRIEPGIIENTGIIIGRVFVDKNFDGEQQPGEPGVPDAVIFLEDGNRIITDPDGLFSVANVLPGHHTGVLDLTSIPEYRLAPNLRFSERNSTSRLVKLEPGGMVRMNFGVTPTATGEETESRRKIPSKPKKPAKTKTPKKQQPQTELTIPNSDL